MNTNKIDTTVKENNMLSSGDTVVVGVSGGADSMFLLNYLISIKDEYNLNIIVANVEHGIRGEESINDSNFVKEFCNKNNVTFKMKSINAVEESKNASMGVEEYSRQVRYDFFKSLNGNKIATAHNLTDNVETVLFRLSRGTSIKGCCGIPPVRDNIIRPLINCTSQEIRQSCKDMNIPFVIDSTNNDNNYSRNYIRNQIIPDFKQLNPSFENVFSRFIDSVNEDEQFIEQTSSNCFDDCFSKNSLQISKLKKYPPSVAKRAIIKFISLYNVSLDDCHLNGVYNLINKAGRFQIKNNVFAIADKHKMRVAIFEEIIDFDEIKINKKIISHEEFLKNCKLYTKQFDFFCDYDKIVGEITIRSREVGDMIAPAGRNCSKTLKKLYNEYKIPVEDRDNIPVIIDEKGLIGIYGYCCDDRVKIDNTTTSVILFNIHMEDFANE